MRNTALLRPMYMWVFKQQITKQGNEKYKTTTTTKQSEKWPALGDK